jgi:hypothetical protein
MQTSQEPFEWFPADLKHLVRMCEFGDHESKLFKNTFIHTLEFMKSLVHKVPFFPFNLYNNS